MSDVPECLRHRPFDERRKLPVPFVHEIEGRWDFTVMQPQRLAECIERKLCGQCGRPLGYWLAFIGGPISASTRVYSDPPMHEECARAALALCPHITRADMKRADLSGTPAVTSPYAVMERPPFWVMGITRGYTLLLQEGQAPLFHARPWKEVYGFRNRDDGPGLVELTQLDAVKFTIPGATPE